MPERALEIAGETLIARADASLFWLRQSTLFVADIHLGKAATFRSLAVPVPVGTTSSALARLDRALTETGATALVFLGDLFHAKEGLRPEILSSLAAWRRSHAQVKMSLIEGNHDRRSGELPTEIGIDCVQEPFAMAPFSLCHYPTDDLEGYCLSGHLHPAVALRSRARQTMRLPCFWFGATCAVLPAFGDFTGTAEIDPAEEDRVLAIAEGRLHEVALVRS